MINKNTLGIKMAWPRKSTVTKRTDTRVWPRPFDVQRLLITNLTKMIISLFLGYFFDTLCGSWLR